MAVSFQSSAVATANGTSVSVSLNAGAGSDRVLYAAHHQPGTATGATYNSVAMTSVKTEDALEMFELVAPSTGSNTLRVSNSSYSRGYLVAAVFNGVDQTTPAGTITGQSASSSTPTIPTTTCPTDGMVYGAMMHDYSSSTAVISGVGNTLASALRTGGKNIAGGYRSSTGQVAWSTGTSYSYDSIGVPINAAGGAPALSTNKLTTSHTLDRGFGQLRAARLGGILQ